MSDKPLLLKGVACPQERPVLERAAARMQTLFGTKGRPVQAQIVRPQDALQGGEDSILILSLRGDCQRLNEPRAVARERWRTRVSKLTSGTAPVFVCTVFHHLERGDTQGEERARLIHRIRELNLMAAELSHEFGVGVVDVDRVCTLLGGIALGCDYRLSSPRGVQAAARAVLWALLSFGLDDQIPLEVQERGKAELGSGMFPGWEGAEAARAGAEA